MFLLIRMLLIMDFDIFHQPKEFTLPQTSSTIQRTTRPTRRNINVKTKIGHFGILSHIEEFIGHLHVAIDFKFFDELA